MQNTSMSVSMTAQGRWPMCKEEFFQSINEDTFFGYQFCKMLYGYSLYDPPFLEAVLDKFRGYGRGAVEHIYSCYLYCQLRAEHEMLKPIGRKIAEKIDRDYERMVKKDGNSKTTGAGDWHGFKGFPPIH